MTKQTRQEKADAQLAELRRQHEECGGDYLTWAKKYNRHTLKVCLINEQTGEESWCSGEAITFINEDNAISHLNVVGEFLLLLAKKTILQAFQHKRCFRKPRMLRRPRNGLRLGEWKPVVHQDLLLAKFPNYSVLFSNRWDCLKRIRLSLFFGLNNSCDLRPVTHIL